MKKAGIRAEWPSVTRWVINERWVCQGDDCRELTLKDPENHEGLHPM